MHQLSAELAMRAFEADASFSTALAQFQAGVTPGINPVQAARAATAHGFSWLARPSGPNLIEVRLRHSGGADAVAEGQSLTELLAGLLGVAIDRDAPAAEPEAQCPLVAPQVEPEPEQVAEQPEASSPLLDEEQKATAVLMCKAMDAVTRKAFTISFRDAFRVDRDARSIIPLITELKHLEFIDRFSIEAAGGVSE
jgi:hypothetical protein